MVGMAVAGGATLALYILFSLELEALVTKRLEKDRMVGMAVAGGATLALYMLFS